MSERPALEVGFAARADALSGVRERIRETLSRAGVDEAAVADVLLAVGEACQNIIRHCYGGGPGRIELTLHRDAAAIEVVLTDFGPTGDPATFAGRDLDDVRPGGLGLHLIHQCMDDVVYDDPPPGGGNTLRMTRRLARTALPDEARRPPRDRG